MFDNLPNPHLGLIYYASRSYDPQLSRWLTIDPAGFVNTSNLYQFLLNNPYSHVDPDGRIVFAIPVLIWGAQLALPTLSAIVMPIVYTAVTAAVACGGYHLADAINQKNLYNQALNYKGSSGRICSSHSSRKKWKKDDPLSKTTDVYAPDRPLPNDKNGNHIPDTYAPHTQLGTRNGKKGKYPQAREFDENGKPVKDIDFTDHGYPDNHPNPHQHIYKPNPTSRTPQRTKGAEPLEGWKY